MKNIHVLPTDKPSRLLIDTIENKLYYQPILHNKTVNVLTQHIYITSDEEIKPNVYALINGVLCKTELLDGRIVSRQLTGGATMDICKSEYSEIILTTDQDFIQDGVQAIEDEFLEWFVKNPSCEEVETYSLGVKNQLTGESGHYKYEIIIPKEENSIEAKQRAENYMSLKGALEPVVDSPLNIYQMKIYNELESLGFFEWLSETHNLKDTDMKPEYLDELPLDDIHRTVCNSMALRWFREKYKIRFIIQSSMSDLGEYFKVIFPNGEQRNVSYNTPEEAELACLNKLIEIVKKK